jgi:hypothetical protein
MAGFFSGVWRLCCANDEGAAGRVDNTVGDNRRTVDFENALDLHKQAVKEPEVAASDAGDRGDGLCIGEVGFVQCEAELAPMPGQNEGQFVALQGPLVMGKTNATVKLRIAG